MHVHIGSYKCRVACFPVGIRSHFLNHLQTPFHSIFRDPHCSWPHASPPFSGLSPVPLNFESCPFFVLVPSTHTFNIASVFLFSVSVKLLPVDCERKTDEVSLCCSEEARFHQEGHSPSQRSPEDYFLGGCFWSWSRSPLCPTMKKCWQPN